MADNKTYGLDPLFERQVAQLAATSKSFWGRIGEHIDPDMLKDENCQLVVSACKSIAADNGRAPDMPSVVLQRISRWNDEGRVSFDALNTVQDLIYEAMAPKAVLNEEAIVTELVPIVRRQMEKEALEKGLDSYGKRKQLSSVSMLLDKAYRVGAVDMSTSSPLSLGSVDNVVALKKMKRLGTGIPSLDSVLNGGMPCACFGVVMGPAKAGKSMFLCHVAANALIEGHNVAYASLEISEAHLLARIIANLTDLPSEAIIDDIASSTARERLENLEKLGKLPLFLPKFFPPDVTTVQDIRDWVDREEQRLGQKFTVVCTDYVQLIGANKGGKALATHQAQKFVAQEHLLWARQKDAWIWTAAQPRRSAEGGKNKRTKISLDDVADGMYITRTCDLGISINPQENGMEYHVAGFRHGEGGQTVGPYKTFFECARMSYVQREGWPYWSPEPQSEM